MILMYCRKLVQSGPLWSTKWPQKNERKKFSNLSNSAIRYPILLKFGIGWWIMSIRTWVWAYV